MLETFMKLYDCVQQALIKIKMSHLLEPVNRDLMLELVQALEPKKVCVMEISRSDADLMSADITLEFMLDKLSDQKSDIAAQVYKAVKIRVTQRRQKLMASLLSHLINPEFKMSSKHESLMRQRNKKCQASLSNSLSVYFQQKSYLQMICPVLKKMM